MKYKELDELEGQQKGGSLDFQEIMRPYFYRWPVFVLAILFSLFIALLYLRYTKPVYNINSLLLIKDEKKSGANSDMLNQLDLFGSSKVVDNEIEIIKSKTLILEVINRLNLDVSLNNAGRVIDVEVYDNKPIQVKTTAINKAYYGKTFTLSFPDSSTFLLQDPTSDEKISGKLNQLQSNQLGTFIMASTPHLKQNLKETFLLRFFDPELLVGQYASRLSIEPSSKQSTVLRLSFKTYIPARGIDVLNTLTEVYNEASLQDKNRTVKNTIDFINERLKLITVELTDVEKSVESFKSSQGLTDISSEAGLFLENVKATDAQLNEVNLKLNVIRSIKKYLKESTGKQQLPSTLGIEDPVLLEQISQLYALELQKVNLLATLPESNPVFNPINEQIRNLKANVTSSLNGMERTLENMRSGLAGYNAKYESSIKKIPGQEREFISIKRQQSIKENLYLFLLQKKEEAILSYASAAADTRVVESASLEGQISPKKMQIVGLAFLAGFILAFIYVYIKELLNNKINSVKELKSLTSVPVLGEVMEQEDGSLIEADSRSAIAEQFRAIRTNLQYYHRKQKPGTGMVTLLTSSMSGEGKSFVACNIVAVHAISGKRTVILELDLRKPKVSKYLGVKQGIGLSNYLIGKAKISEIIQQSAQYPNLSVIGAGPVPPNPSELLIGKEIDELVDYLKENYDEIIIDTPPIGLVTDSQIMARLADTTLFLVRQNVTFKNQMESLNDIYQQGIFPKLSIIVNGVKSSESYGYGYGYGYYSHDLKNQDWRSKWKNFKERLI